MKQGRLNHAHSSTATAKYAEEIKKSIVCSFVSDGHHGRLRQLVRVSRDLADSRDAIRHQLLLVLVGCRRSPHSTLRYDYAYREREKEKRAALKPH